MNNFQSFLDEADAYFLIINNSLAKNGKLGAKVLYSLSTMAIEKYMVAVLMIKGNKVSSHNLSSLVGLLVKNFDHVPDEIKALAHADEKIDLCSFNPVNTPEPGLGDIQKLFANLTVLKTFVYGTLENANKPAFTK